MEIDPLKVTGNPQNNFEVADAINKAHQEIFEALHIIKSTIENFEDNESLAFNKERMVKYLNKFAKL